MEPTLSFPGNAAVVAAVVVIVASECEQPDRCYNVPPGDTALRRLNKLSFLERRGCQDSSP